MLLTGGGWLGLNNDWATASNWCSNSVPTSSTDVVISNAAGIVMPSINAGTGAASKSVTISNTFPVSSLTIAASGTASLSLYGNFTNSGTFTDNSTASSAGVKLVGSTAQTIQAITTNNLTIANTSGATPAITITTDNLMVNSNLTVTSGIVNLNGLTITLGTAAASTGTLAYAAGRFYSGNIQRWFPTSTIAVGNVAGQFPIGTSADYRPLYLGNAGLSAGGTIKVRHTGSSGATAYGTPFVDNLGTVALRSNSFWTVSTADGLGTGTHNLRTEATGMGTVGAVTDLRQTLVNGIAPGSDGAHAGTTSNPQVNRTGLTTANLSNGFYWGSINPVNTPLPIALTDFYGIPVKGGVSLKWKTESEESFDYFEVQRSSDGYEFLVIAKEKGAGTRTTPTTYSYLDANASDRNYYRLKIIDLNRSFTFSKVIVVDVGERAAGVFVYPNPIVNKKFTIEFINSDPSEARIILVDLLGRNCWSETLNGSLQDVELPAFITPGIYFLRTFKGFDIWTIKVIIN